VVAYGDVERGTEGIYIGLEGFWSYVERWLYHYRGVPKQYFHLYLKEIEFRFNNRNKYMFQMLSKLLVEPLPTNS
jgi:transposase-like protein